MKNCPKNDLIKIKEDAIKIQEADLADTLNCTEAENRKCSYVILFVPALLIALSNNLGGFYILHPWRSYSVFAGLVFGVVSVGVALYSMWPKKVGVHTNTDDVFNMQSMAWEKYLSDLHLSLKERYQNAQNMLHSKTKCTKVSFCFVVGCVVCLTISIVIGMITQ